MIPRRLQIFVALIEIRAGARLTGYLSDVATHAMVSDLRVDSPGLVSLRAWLRELRTERDTVGGDNRIVTPAWVDACVAAQRYLVPKADGVQSPAPTVAGTRYRSAGWPALTYSFAANAIRRPTA